MVNPRKGHSPPLMTIATAPLGATEILRQQSYPHCSICILTFLSSTSSEDDQSKEGGQESERFLLGLSSLLSG